MRRRPVSLTLLPPPRIVDAVDTTPDSSVFHSLASVPWEPLLRSLTAIALWREYDILSRSLSHNSSQQRRSFAFRHLRRVKSTMRALQDADVAGTWARIRAAAEKTQDGTMPSAEALEDAAVHLGAAARLALLCRREAQAATIPVASAVARGHFMSLYVVLLAVLCSTRVALLALAKACCVAHNRLAQAAPLAVSRMHNPPPRARKAPLVLAVVASAGGGERVVAVASTSNEEERAALGEENFAGVEHDDDDEDLGEAVDASEFMPLESGLGVWMDTGGGGVGDVEDEENAAEEEEEEEAAAAEEPVVVPNPKSLDEPVAFASSAPAFVRIQQPSPPSVPKGPFVGAKRSAKESEKVPVEGIRERPVAAAAEEPPLKKKKKKKLGGGVDGDTNSNRAGVGKQKDKKKEKKKSENDDAFAGLLHGIF